jgi:HK97 family phage portal protein
MGILSGIRPKALSPTTEKLLREFFGGNETASGVSVSSDTAMQQDTVYACVNDLRSAIGMLPCHMMKKNGKNRDVADDFYLYPILHDMPNEWMTSDEFWGMVVAHLLLRGNFFALKNRGFNKISGQIRELIPLAPGIVQEVIQNRDYSLAYKCQYPDGTTKDIPGSEIMHLRGLVMDGFMGLNPIEWIRESIGLAQATQEFGARYFGNGTHPGMIIEKEGPALSAQALANYKASISEAYSGLGKAHRFMLLEEGMKAKSITINPEDAQFLETRNYQRKAIVDIFFTMPLTIICGADSTPTFASAEQFSINFVIYALMPWLVKIEKGIYRDLLTPEERKTYYAKFNAAGLQRGSFVEQMAGFATAIDKEILNPNECRALLDMNPYAGGEVYKTRTSTTKDTAGNSAGGTK